MSDKPLPLFRVLIEEYNYQHPSPKQRYTALEAAIMAYEAVQTADQRKRVNSEQTKKFFDWLHESGVRRSALCFSGGGIRSATFGLGVLQGLAKQGQLTEFDFLSTVSGGGFLGSWLSAWIHRKGLSRVQDELKNDHPASPLSPEPEPVAHLRRFSNYMSPKLGLLSADTWTLVAIFLRNLLLNWLILFPLILLALMVPRFCIKAVTGSLDGIPDLLLPGKADGAFWVALALGIVSIAYVYISRPSLADKRVRARPGSTDLFGEDARTQLSFLRLCLVPLLGMAVSITTYYAWLRKPMQQILFPRFGAVLSSILFFDRFGIPAQIAQQPWFAFLCFGLMLNGAGLLLALAWRRLLNLRFALESVFVLFVGGSGGLLTWLIATKLFDNPASDIKSAVVYVCFAAPAFLGLFLLAGTIFVGIASRVLSDADREWTARAGAWILIAASVWIVVSTIVIYGPAALVASARWAIASVSLGAISGLVTLVLGKSGRSSAKGKESLNSVDIVLMFAAPIFAVFLLMCLSLGTSWLMVEIGHVGTLSDLTSFDGLLKILRDTPFAMLIWTFAALAAIGGAASILININRFSLHGAYRDRLIRAYLGASRAEGERKPNPFTGLDENDNLQMQQLRTQFFHADNVDQQALANVLRNPDEHLYPQITKYVKGRLSAKTKKWLEKGGTLDELKYGLIDDLNTILQGDSIYQPKLFPADLVKDPAIQELLRQKPLVESLGLNRLLLEGVFTKNIIEPVHVSLPLHVINTTLNLVGGKNLAWQDRKAESFTMSALHSGSFCLGYRNSNVYGRDFNNQAISLGTAATISGAAVSPNMGYYSSAFVTFLLALFNLRLGWWLGNPGLAGSRQWSPSTYDKPGPNFAAYPLIAETFGLTDDSHPYVYLSDGGHFENLGLYEMVLRRCKRIVISDGSADPAFGFEGLGNAVSKIRVDLGIPIDFTEIAMLPRDDTDKGRHYGEPNPKFVKKYCAVGTIGYSCVDGNGNSADKKKYDGVLVYIKAFLAGTEPVDIYNYAKTHESFPHQSTADQMYGESQFESYRALGLHIINSIPKDVFR